MTTPDTPPEQLIGPYLAGELPADVADRVHDYIEAHPGRRGMLAGVTAAMRGAPFAAVPDRHRSWDTLVGRMEQENVRVEQRPSRRTIRPAASAVAITLVALLAVFVFWPNHPQERPHTYQTPAGHQSTVRLADGSSMMLAPATSVTVSHREIRVVGEAYFTVMPQAGRPFVVRTANAMIQVLGTQFSVRHYPSDTTSRVVVAEGRVALRAIRFPHPNGLQSDPQTVMSSRMLAVIGDSGVTVTEGISPRDYVGWTQGVLVFNQIALRDVIADLERAYGTEIRIADTTLAKRRLYLDVSVHEDPLRLVLDHICEATDAHYTTRTTHGGQSFLLSPGRMAASPPQRDLQHRQYPQPDHQYGK